MNKTTKNILLVITIIVIVAAIVFLEMKKPPHVNPNDAADVIVPTTAVGTGATAATQIPKDRSATQAAKTKKYSHAKELENISGYINTSPFTLSQLAGNKVILIDFWTYSCINCQRTIPYLNAWYQKYKNSGLVIVGVSSPEFDFEKNYPNVAAAVKQLGIQYPVVLDNDMATWQAYNNEYWPAEYLIDIDGFVVHTNFGEGSYPETEMAIQQALRERDAALGLPDTVPTGIVSPDDVISMNANQIQSPETYFGSNRNEYLGNGKQSAPGSQTLSIPTTIQGSALYLDGTWNFTSEYAQSTSPTSKIVYEYSAKNMYLVASSDSAIAPNGVVAKVLLDGKPIPTSEAGSDVSSNGTITIQADKLYNLVNGTSYGTHTLELDIESPGLDAYTFTFG